MSTNNLIASLPDMAVFVTVVEEGSFSAASRKLGVTPSAVSRQLSRLETSLGVKLLERTTRKMSLSLAGQPVFEHCRQMLDAARDAMLVSQLEASEPTGLLRVGAPKALARRILEPAILSFIEAYPKVELQLRVSDHIIDPIQDEIDVMISLTHTPNPGLIAKVIGHVNNILCASPTYLKQQGIPLHPKDLSLHSCISLGENTQDTHWSFLPAKTALLESSTRTVQKINVNIKGRYSVNHSEMRLSAVIRGLGIGVLSDHLAYNALNNGKIVQVLADWQLQHRYQGAINLQYAQSKFIPVRLRLFVDHIAQYMQQNTQCKHSESPPFNTVF